jgi:hypothetical protein
MKNLCNKKKLILTTSICIFFGIFLRLYNINYENLWYDEILSFWIADPEISIKESLKRHRSIEQVPFLFNFILKFLFKIFSYEPSVGRYLSLIFNFLGIVFIIKIFKQLKKNNSHILGLFLLCTNIYLIGYSQELRVYSMMLFLCSLNLWLYVFILQKNKKSKKISFSLSISFILSQILMIISHPFCLIVFFSTSIFSLLNYLKFNVNIKLINYSILITIIFSIIYFLIYVKKIDTYPGWIVQPDIKFYTNFYFSKFFGSRLVGLIHLIILIYLLFIFRKKFKNEFFNLNIFLIILFLSYFLPMLFGYLFRPIIFPRYIIFVLIPIIVLLAFLVFEIKNKITKNILITIIITLTLGNHYTESTIQQFIKERPFHKTNFSKALNEISQSKNKNYILDLKFSHKREVPSINAIQNYINKLSSNMNITINYIKKDDFINSNLEEIWTICILGIMKDRCSVLDKNLNSKIIHEKYFSDINIRQIKKIN